MEGIELPPDGHLFTLAPAAVIPEDAHIYLLFHDYTQIFYIPTRRGHVFVAFLCVYCSAIKTSLKNQKLSLHSKFLILLQFLRVIDRHELYQWHWHPPLMRLQRTMQVTLGGNKHNGDRERRKRGIDWRHNYTEQKYVKYIHTQLSNVILIV